MSRNRGKKKTRKSKDLPGAVPAYPVESRNVPQSPQADIPRLLETAVDHQRGGRSAEAKVLYEEILRQVPDHADALHLSGLLAHQTGDAKTAVARIRRAIERMPEQTVFRFNLGVVLAESGRVDEALAAYGEVIQRDDRYVQAHFNRANLLWQARDMAGASAAFEKALAVKPDYGKAIVNLAGLRHEQGRHDEALSLLRRAANLDPHAAMPWFKMGFVLKDMARPDEALDAYRKAVALAPGWAKAHNNIGNILHDRGDRAGALTHYDQAVAAEPAYFLGHFNRGNALQMLDRPDEALAAYDAAAAFQPDHPDLHLHRSVILRRMERMSDSIAACRRAVEAKPDFLKARSVLVHQLQYQCEWDEIARLAPELDTAIDAAIAAGEPLDVTPFEHIVRVDDPMRNLAVARGAAQRIEKLVAGLVPPFDLAGRVREKDVLTIGYVSHDFRNHPVGHLISGLFGAHDRRHFRIHAYSHGPDDGSPHRRRVAGTCDRFVDIRGMSHADAARLIHADGVDILVDLMGHTQDARLEIFALRPAPVQVSFLGYPGSTGARFMDYLITDRVVTPPEQAACFTERLIQMPECYQVNDAAQPIARTGITRTSEGLPETGVVFSSFNQSYKIEPVLFGVWMSILRQVPGSVLWLLGGDSVAEANLRQAAGKRGVDPGRLVFAAKIDKPRHLERQALADIALDTRVVNGHTTTSDALWAGVPVITLAGRHFASRVAASLLTAVDLSGLVTLSLGEYERLAVRLAMNPAEVADLKKRLWENRTTCPLFHTTRYARFLEGAFQAIWKFRLTGREPRVLSLQGGDAPVPAKSVEVTAPPAPAYAAEIWEAFRLHREGRREEAGALYETILAGNPDHSDALHLSGLLAHERGDRQLAVERIRRAIGAQPQVAIFHRNLASVYQALGDTDQVIACCRKAIELKPDFAEAHNTLGVALKQSGRIEDAIAAYQKAVEFAPGMVEAMNNLGNAHGEVRRHDEAIVWYRRALEVKPDGPEIHNNLGAAYKEKGDLEQSIACYRRAIEIKPDFAEAYSNLGSALRDKGNLEQTAEYFRKAIELKPDLTAIHNDLFFILRQLCEWDDCQRLSDQLDRMSNEALAKGEKTVESPFSNLIRHPDPGRNVAIARSWSTHIARSMASSTASFSFEKRRTARPKIRIGYVSNDFRNHAVSHLIVNLFRHHDRNRFEIFCYSHGQDDGSGYRRKIMADCDKFTDVYDLGFEEAARRIHADEVDILVDLMGYTKGHRLQIAALRPAPVQVSFLGFPGSTGASFFDYFVTDRIITPEPHLRFYHEKCVMMPHCYQVNDGNQPISDRAWTRAEFGLPENAVVFCSFNQSYKIEPVMFGTWMEILKQVEGSVLWLLKRGDVVTRNLSEAARRHGVDPSRLIFTDRMVKHEHLARHRLADLALDTRIVNGHTTTSDALWAGVPVITLAGTHFAGRVATSILAAVGLPELVTGSLEAYRDLAIRLASHPEERQTLRDKLAANRKIMPLFDTARYARALEGAYQVMWNTWVDGGNPRHIVLNEQGGSPLEIPAAAMAPITVGVDPRMLIHQGMQQQQAGRFADAIALYRKSLEILPEQIVAYGNLGNCHQVLGQLTEAGECYEKVIQLKPDSAEAYNNLGNVYEGQKNPDKAIECYSKAVEMKPDFAQAYNNLGVVYRTKNQMGKAMEAYEKAIAINPSLDKTYNSLVYLYQQFCLWDKVAKSSPELDRLTRETLEKNGKPGESPFTCLTRTADPALNYRVARSWSAELEQAMNNLKIPFDFEPRRHVPDKKIVVGYLSNDFRNHAVAHLIAGLFSLHDRSRFRVHAYSHGVDDKSKYRERVAGDCDLFRDIRELDRQAAARQVYEDGVDILVDLMGYTKDNRLELCALRPAPIQVEFLGFPGTTGALFFDYLISDRTISPPSHAPFYSEKLAWMPHCYQVNDGRQPIAETPYTRTEQRLPENGFVFCSFNQPYKIDAVQFDLWMRILKRVPNSVLWLLLRSSAGERRLKQEAAARGIDPARLIVADVKSKDEHLARHRLADLGLDTRIVNGHTTTSDALWAGVPVITLLGRHFASRVASSILEAAGLPELVTHSLKEYEELAVRLATHPEELKGFRDRLAVNRLSYPIFDTARYARNLEKAYTAMWERFKAGQSPDLIEVRDDDPPLVTKRDYVPEATAEDDDVFVHLNYDTAAVSGGPVPVMEPETRQMTLGDALRFALEHHQAGRHDMAETVYRQVLAAKPGFPDALHLYGVLHHQRGNHGEAVKLLRQAVEAVPGNGLFHANLGAALQAAGRFREAVAHHEKALELKPDYAEALLNLATTRKHLGEMDQAVADLEKAVALRPDHVGSHNSLGMMLVGMGRLDESLPHFRKALELAPNSPDILYQASLALRRQDEAIACLKKAVTLSPGFDKAVASLVHRMRNVCDWAGVAEWSPRLDALTDQCIAQGRKTGEQPLMNLAARMDPARNLAVAKTWAAHVAGPARSNPLDPPAAPPAGGKFRIGYLSGDFRNHPVGHLIAGLFGLHDRNAFEIFAYGFAADDDSHYRREIQQGCDQYVDIRRMADAEAARRIADDGIHLLVDLMGHTGGENRLGILAFRPAPVQATWLGFPGSTGADFIDVILTDRIVTPESERDHYTERPVYLPHTYQVTDWNQPVSSRSFTRTEMGLPATGFVFCSFNQSYKIEPVIFDTWMDILKRVDGAVLWLLGEDPLAVSNLCAAAQVRGVAPERLVFSSRLPKQEHLSRHRLADLALDTRVVNGHTTTTDALWAGVPVITLKGSHFASRVAASLLTAVNLPELVTETPEAYRDLAVRLARDPAALAAIKQKLAKERLKAPLFDTPGFAKRLEAVYRELLGNIPPTGA